MKPLIPCHLIAGPLGVGKTTAILALLRRQAGREFTAVLTNDFGPVGLDGAIVESSNGQGARERTKVLMVPGGCICCSAATGIITAMKTLAELPRVDRILVEPSGLALLGAMTDLLAGLAGEFGLELRPVITLMDIRQLGRAGFTRVPYFVRMVEATDILVGNRADLATPEQVATWQRWAEGLYPPKLRAVATHHGELPEEIFELRKAAGFAPANGAAMAMSDVLRGKALTGRAREEAGHTDGFHAGGFTWPAEVTVGESRLTEALGQLAMAGLEGAEVARLKGIVRTGAGWRLAEIACGEVFLRDTDYRRENRLDWIAQPRAIAAEAMRRHLGLA